MKTTKKRVYPQQSRAQQSTNSSSISKSAQRSTARCVFRRTVAVVLQVANREGRRENDGGGKDFPAEDRANDLFVSLR